MVSANDKSLYWQQERHKDTWAVEKVATCEQNKMFLIFAEHTRPSVVVNFRIPFSAATTAVFDRMIR